MPIWVSSLSSVHHVAQLRRPDKILSLLAPEDEFPVFEGVANDAHTRIGVDDIFHKDDPELTSPNEAHVHEIIRFADGWNRANCLVIHCWAGISRSSASAFISACVLNPRTDEHDIAEAIRAASPVAKPNRLFVEIADDILGRRGRMVEALNEIGEGAFAEINTPFVIPSQFDAKGGHI